MNTPGPTSSRFLGASLLLGTVFLALGLVQEATGQAGPSFRSAERPVQVALDPTYQYYDTEDGQVLTQASTDLTVSVPIGQRFTVQARAGYAQMDSDLENGEQVRGLTDATARLSYAQQLGESSLVLAANVNAPVGKQELTDPELETTRLISRNFYDFRVSSFSRGFSVAPQVTWAYPITDRVAVGIGGGYQYQRGFQPQANQEGDYVPGDGVGANGGVDYKITETSALGVDVAFRRYGADRLDGARRFDAGTRLSGTLRYLLQSGFTTIRVVGRYSNWGKSEFDYQFGAPKQKEVIPSHALLMGSYRTPITDQIGIRARLSGHHYAETIQADAKILGRAYVSPSFEFGDAVTLAPHGTVTYGSYLGVGGGLRVQGEF